MAPPPHETQSTAIVLDGWKLLHHTQRAEGQPEYELFNHGEDPLNLEDLAPVYGEVVARLAAELDAWRASVAGSLLEPDEAGEDELSADELERLRALGYVQ